MKKSPPQALCGRMRTFMFFRLRMDSSPVSGPRRAAMSKKEMFSLSSTPSCMPSDSHQPRPHSPKPRPHFISRRPNFKKRAGSPCQKNSGTCLRNSSRPMSVLPLQRERAPATKPYPGQAGRVVKTTTAPSHSARSPEVKWRKSRKSSMSSAMATASRSSPKPRLKPLPQTLS